VVEHRVGIFNPPDNPAIDGVRVNLIDMNPHPRHVLNAMTPVIPYTVPLVTGGDATVGLTLHPGREELWLIGYTSTGSDETMYAGGFAVADQRWRGLPWQVGPDERWRFSYQIVCDAHPAVSFSIVVYADNGTLRCTLEG
jgi:hypothetical protein